MIRTRFMDDTLVSQYAWTNLKRYHNDRYTCSIISTKHEIPSKQKNNVLKQALQTRYALIQAKEYYDSSLSSSLATKPTQLYYCSMWLAIAEILVCQDGNSSLDRLRAAHSHHGLDVRIDDLSKDHSTNPLDKLRASIFKKADGTLVGTFGVWQSSATSAPVAALRKVIQKSGTIQTSPFIMFQGSKLNNVTGSFSISLMECIKSIPLLWTILRDFNLDSILIRADIKGTVDYRTDIAKISLTTHPSNKNQVDKLFGNIGVRPDAMEDIEIDILPFDSFRLTITRNLFLRNESIFHIPDGISLSLDETYLFPENQKLNEFGYMYVGLFILSNISRYYADYWMWHVDNCTELSLLCENFLQICQNRLPLLTLSAISGIAYLEKNRTFT